MIRASKLGWLIQRFTPIRAPMSRSWSGNDRIFIPTIHDDASQRGLTVATIIKSTQDLFPRALGAQGIEQQRERKQIGRMRVAAHSYETESRTI